LPKVIRNSGINAGRAYFHHKVEITPQQKSDFKRDGFAILPKLIPENVATKLRARIEPLFSGKFETGIYPDEWYYRPGMSREDITREMCNAWKCDRTIASVVGSAEIARLACEFMDWPGARLAQDDIFWKPNAGKEIFFHQDLPYFNFIVPSEVITVWIALTPASLENGTLEYARGSHLWPTQSNMTEDFHAPKKDYREAAKRAAAGANCDLDIVSVIVPAGGGSVHHGATWHGSGVNPSSVAERISLVVHLIRSDSVFKPTGVGYIYGRYKIFGSTTMEETFFPILYTKSGYRSKMITEFCEDAIV